MNYVAEKDEDADIALIYASDGMHWVEYFRDVFLHYKASAEKIKLVKLIN